MRHKVYVNGEIVEGGAAKISIYDSALMFGDMVFEMIRTFNGRPFNIRKHLERFYAGVKIFKIPLEIDMEEMERICYEVIKVNEPLFGEDEEHRLMIEVSRGPLGIYSSVEGVGSGPTVVVSDVPLKATARGMNKLFETGVNAIVPSQRSISAQFLDPKIKNRSRAYYQMANLEIANCKGENNWALLIDSDGFITEGTGGNVFIVKNKKLFTPEGRNILRGINRDYVFDLCKQLGLECVEKNIDQYDVSSADEVFFTGTPFCIMPVTGFNYGVVGDGKMGEITRLLLNTWSQNVGVDIVEQIKVFNRDFI